MPGKGVTFRLLQTKEPWTGHLEMSNQGVEGTLGGLHAISCLLRLCLAMEVVAP